VRQPSPRLTIGRFACARYFSSERLGFRIIYRQDFQVVKEPVQLVFSCVIRGEDEFPKHDQVNREADTTI